MTSPRRILSRRDALFALGGFAAGGALILGGTRSLRLARERAFAEEQARRAVRVVRLADDGWLLSDEERAALAERDALRDSDVLEIRDAVDLPGGDFAEERVTSLDACITSCEEDARCMAFTYARTSHPLPEKRQMCWLKSAETAPAVTDTPVYVSGRRDGW
ncbi:MAG: PAN domain-containing protein [Pseudomonadota bacterium]